VLIDARGYVKLVDFGLSCHYDHLARADLIAGTPEYLPPEVFGRGGVKLGRFTDWWALGNLIFEMVAGFPPFFQQNEKFERTKGRICEQDPPLYFLSNPILRDLLQLLLQKDPLSRLGTKGAQ
jgi:serine/threonine protein kinase